jgi:amphi-Trp domain-containing protein
MKFEEKKTMARKEIADLLKGLGEIIEEGGVKIGGTTRPISESATVEVEYKEKNERAKLEIEIKWKVGEVAHPQEKIIEPESSVHDLKQTMKKIFNSIRSNLDEDKITSSEDLDRFIGINNVFKDFSEKRLENKKNPVTRNIDGKKTKKPPRLSGLKFQEKHIYCCDKNLIKQLKIGWRLNMWKKIFIPVILLIAVFGAVLLVSLLPASAEPRIVEVTVEAYEKNLQFYPLKPRRR